MDLQLSPCSTSARMTFLDVVGAPTKLVIFVKKKKALWRVELEDKTTGQSMVFNYETEMKPDPRLAGYLLEKLNA